MKRSTMLIRLSGVCLSAMCLALAIGTHAQAQGVWETRAPMPTGREVVAVGVVNGVLYAIGGNGNPQLQTVEAYDPGTNTWTTKAPMPTPRMGLGVGLVNGVLYAVGGRGSSLESLQTVEAYDPLTNTWATKAPMPTPRQYLSVGVVNGVLYAVGGAVDVNGGALQTVEAYDPATNTWATKAPMPTARWLLAVGVVNDVLLAIGGAIPGDIQTVEAYDPLTNTWTTKAPMPTPRHGLGVGVVNDVLFAIGGYNGGFLQTVEAYDPLTNTWTTKAPMPTPRLYLSVGVVNGVLYAVGGQNDSGGSLATNEAFTPPNVPFDAFAPTVGITLGPLANDDEFRIKATLTLGTSSDGIAPLTEAVTIHVGSVSATIPSGSFKFKPATKKQPAQYTFAGIIEGVTLTAKITPLGGKLFEFRAVGIGVNLAGTVNPVHVGLILGDDQGSAEVTAPIIIE